MRWLVGCLLWCCSSSAQVVFPLKDSSVVKEIDLPATEPFDTSRSWHRVTNPYVYIISDKDIYDLFGYEIAVKFQKFNFADHHILGQMKCRQCMAFCHHEEGQTTCHRNRCNKEWIWVMRENKKALNEVTITTSRGHTGVAASLAQSLSWDDSLVRSIANTDKANWYVTGHGDCMASFQYQLFTDKYHPVLLLKERNYWGGCRAGGSKSYTVSFTMPPGILYSFKNTILVKGEHDY